jgi:uncharacterized protein YajQ (UPF0234 family)
MSAPQPASHNIVVLPAAMREFILEALGEASQALSRTHGLRATRHILVREGMQLTEDNSFRINHLNQVLVMNLIRRMLSAPPADEPPPE